MGTRNTVSTTPVAAVGDFYFSNWMGLEICLESARFGACCSTPTVKNSSDSIPSCKNLVSSFSSFRRTSSMFLNIVSIIRKKSSFVYPEVVIEATERVNTHDFICGLPKQHGTRVACIVRDSMFIASNLTFIPLEWVDRFHEGLPSRHRGTLIGVAHVQDTLTLVFLIPVSGNPCMSGLGIRRFRRSSFFLRYADFVTVFGRSRGGISF
ncbi:hypothetical protein TSMEX_001097 [Taenia solium]|eukprot:TsM_000214800 transcript=TsM_000214800 gene=TsM_000214800